ncbi:hypothetical protein HZH66_002928 [Vespula vulgaris]|uniref:Uncharacterized protein n=1 Tax=Vespula vulgaris TaxID=7454 RepID=A0A834KQM1_VESVU|nr:hypothetical protein HZH66_002928 [Vespula vulgaris]
MHPVHKPALLMQTGIGPTLVSNAWPPCTHLDSPWENQQTRPRTAVILPDGQWLPTNIRPRQASPRTLTLCKTPGV